MSKPNQIGWFEISVKDVEKAKTFFEKIFNWQYKTTQSQGQDYCNIFTGENSPGGGFNIKTSGTVQSDNILIYVEVEDIEATLNKIVSLGGKIINAKTIISEHSGYYALFADLDGNTIGLWSKG